MGKAGAEWRCGLIWDSGYCPGLCWCRRLLTKECLGWDMLTKRGGLQLCWAVMGGVDRGWFNLGFRILAWPVVG